MGEMCATQCSFEQGDPTLDFSPQFPALFCSTAGECNRRTNGRTRQLEWEAGHECPVKALIVTLDNKTHEAHAVS